MPSGYNFHGAYEPDAPSQHLLGWATPTRPFDDRWRSIPGALPPRKPGFPGMFFDELDPMPDNPGGMFNNEWPGMWDEPGDGPLLRRRRPEDIDMGRPPRQAPIQSPSEHRYEFGGKNFLTNLLSRNNNGPQS